MNIPSIITLSLILISLWLSACGGSGDDPLPPEPGTSTTWGEMKWGEGTWGK